MPKPAHRYPSQPIMAFLPQPTLPSTRNPSSKVRVSTRAVADGVISVSRRRRVYEFLSATSKPASPTVPESATPHVSAPESTSTNGISEDVADPYQVRDQLIARMKQREDAIKADAAKKQTLWQAELDALRSTSLQPSPTAPSAAPKKPQRSQTAETEPLASSATAAAPASATASPVTPTASAVAAQAAPAPSKTNPAPTQAPPVDQAPAAEASSAPGASVSDLYAPPPSTEESEESRPWGAQDLVEGVWEVVEDVREAVEDFVEDVRDAVEDVFDGEEEEAEKEKKAPETVSKSEPEAKQVAEEDKQDRSIGEVIIDAIVEGVDAPEGEPDKPAVDKSDLIELVDSGKVKNLTVTKLRRLLTQNGLKTSGRKAELIARLTSFAKAK